MSDVEYLGFFRTIVDPFQKCDDDKNYLIDIKLFQECLLNQKNFLMLQEIQDPNSIEALIHSMGRTEVDIYIFYLLKRVDKAYQVCSENLVIPQVLLPLRIKLPVL